ncbi:MAG: hypothetical protein ACRD63_15480, partial [Pyrinomonadaceae bacterium]
MANGLETLTLHTVPARQAGEGQVIEATFVVRAQDWHPVEQHLRIKVEGEAREYELREISYQVVSLSSLGHSIFADEVAVTATPTPLLSPSPSASVKLTPLPIDLDATEVEVRWALERLGADLGEPIEIVRQSEREVVVRGLVNTAERKAELLVALQNTPNVKTAITTLEEANREAAGKTSDRNTANAESRVQASPEQPASEQVSGRLPMQEQLEKYFARPGNDPDEARRDAEAFSKRALARSESALAEAWALRRLAERYTPAEVNRLNDSSCRKLEAIVRHHLASLHLQTTRASTLVKPVLSVIANESAGAIAADRTWEAAWPGFSSPLLRTVQQVDRLTTALFTVSEHTRVSPLGAARG